MAEVYLRLRWTTEVLMGCTAPVEVFSVRELAWHLECSFWASAPPSHIFDLSPRMVLDHPSGHPTHHRRILTADLRASIAVAQIASRVIVLDGLHRLARCALEGVDVAQGRQIPLHMLCLAG